MSVLKSISLHGLETIPEVNEGDDVAALIHEACTREQIHMTTGDVVLVTSKIVSKAEGRTINLGEVKPSRRARAVARITGKDPVEVEIVLRESRDIRAVIPLRKIADNFPAVFGSMASDDKSDVGRLLAEEPAFLVTTTKVSGGLMSTDAGLDYSNSPSGRCTVLPSNASESASAIRARLLEICGADVAVVVTDTELSFTHIYGSMDIAVGFSGIHPVSRLFGSKDRFGREKFGGADVVVDELAGAAALLMGQTSEGIPVVVVKGLTYEKQQEDGRHTPRVPNEQVLSKGIWWSLLATLKLKFARLLEPFV